ncbi:MAG TPA: hypothetical protein VM241_04005 [Candidatus Thermoplasmatota archaeon]|nr:hypothetical protein [Candidatus Thermoplasmatota archaeon]
MVKVLAMRCPRCTARFELRVTETRRRETCPACGVRLPPAPDTWMERADLDRLTPGTDEELVGAPRKTWKVVVLAIFTLGIYLFIYNFVAFDELDRQHRRRHATGLYLTGLLTIIGVAALAMAFSFAYEAKDRGGRALAIGDQGFTFWTTLGIGIVLTLCILASVAYFIREYAALQGYRKARGLRPGIGSLEFLLWALTGVGLLVALARTNASVRQLWYHIYNEKGVRVPPH